MLCEQETLVATCSGKDGSDKVVKCSFHARWTPVEDPRSCCCRAHVRYVVPCEELGVVRSSKGWMYADEKELESAHPRWQVT